MPGSVRQFLWCKELYVYRDWAAYGESKLEREWEANLGDKDADRPPEGGPAKTGAF